MGQWSSNRHFFSKLFHVLRPKNTLNNIKYLISEVNRDEVYENCPHIDELDEYLSQFNFNRAETNWAGDTWGDAFYIKD